ncbi:AAA family ATPase [Bradyrhizobium sp. CIR3A]|uniref:AAA family ATPase n=1 Tax=Bradyrhizobium sp. CIR3A TaxID=2663838 RepID=UPI0016061170|nr:AAA family ATPase [Bradyrhizobium sp. CIR3A]MBB4259524.1 ABC-type cobalamin/Fe3+-siderophores transport system ATPase subunit [Bradyrhizobium sp. CIR3A]
MTFGFSIPVCGGQPLNFALKPGECAFVLGANGTGKSSLSQSFDVAHGERTRRIQAHRQLWFDSDLINVSPVDRTNMRTNTFNYDKQPLSRIRDPYGAHRPNVAVFDLIDQENSRARNIAAAMDQRDVASATALANTPSLLTRINDLFRISGLPIRLAIEQGAQVTASRNGGTSYSIARLSDGERNALLIAAEVLTAKDRSILIIDEPERHLHRAIISPLLSGLFAERPDCAFVVSTHDVTLANDHAPTITVLLRDCSYASDGTVCWQADLLSAEANVDDQLKLDILGARKKLLFVEGEALSLDKQLYSLIFPGASTIAKGSSRNVMQCVSAIRDADDLHWLDAYGLIDNDNRDEAEIAALKTQGIYALACHSVESIYYHPELQRRLAVRHANVTGANADTLLGEARSAALTAIEPHKDRLSKRAVLLSMRAELMRQMPKSADLEAGNAVRIDLNTAQHTAAEATRFEGLLNAGDLEGLIRRYPIRETGALGAIASKIGFQGRAQYESAVRKLIIDDNAALSFVRGMFGDLAAALA